MSAFTLVQRLTSMRLPLGAFWSLGQTRCLPPRFFAPTNQFAGRWHCNACGGLPPRRALLRSLSHSFAASQANAPAIAEKTFCGHARAAMHTVRVLFAPPCRSCRPCRPWCQCRPHIAHEAQVASMVPMQPLPVHKSLQRSLSAVDLRVHGPGLHAAFTGAPTNGFSSV